MKANTLGFALAAVFVTAAQLPGQQSAAPAPSYYQTLAYVKAAPNKGNDYLQFTRDTTMKVVQVRADAGEIVSWTLLRTVYPAGQEARADFLVSILYEGTPRAAQERAFQDAFKKAGVAMSLEDYYAKRGTLASLIASEMWRIRSRVAAPKKGDYLYLNLMKVRDAEAYIEFENTTWRPMAEEWVKQRAMSGWIFATKVLPSGSDTVYSAYSADMFPSWEAVFASRDARPIFEKIHPGKNYQEFSTAIPKLRELGRRELWEIVERIEKKK